MSKHFLYTMLLAVLGGTILAIVISPINWWLATLLSLVWGWNCAYMVTNWFGVPKGEKQ